MRHGHPIDDLDLLALADGFLDDDPSRKAEIEAAIARDPAAASRLSDYRAQTAALRAAHAGVLAAPVPERLRAVLEETGGAGARPVLRRAAAGVMVVAAGLGGWLIGQEEDDPARHALLEESYRQFVLRGPEMPLPGDAGGAPERAISWIDDEMAIRLSAPDLSSEGFSLVGKRGVSDSGGQLVALDYRAPDGRAFSLFIAPRWTDDPGPIVDRERDGVALAYWHDGPLAASLAAHLPSAEARDLAEAVRRAMRDETTAPPPVLQPEFRPLPSPSGDVMADGLATMPGSEALDAFPGRVPTAVGSN
ncbi:MAG: hypothetical protein ACOCY0_01325 [Roseicyclus sp.]